MCEFRNLKKGALANQMAGNPEQEATGRMLLSKFPVQLSAIFQMDVGV
jgi:hypothetical protein